ncbi:MAG: hypothetical protein R3D90_08795 [Paracoccaceae bacterium]
MPTVISGASSVPVMVTVSVTLADPSAEVTVRLSVSVLPRPSA